MGNAFGAVLPARAVVTVDRGRRLRCRASTVCFWGMPGRFLPRHPKRPRVWGAGALLVVMGGFSFPTLTVAGLGRVASGHAPTDA